MAPSSSHVLVYMDTLNYTSIDRFTRIIRTSQRIEHVFSTMLVYAKRIGPSFSEIIKFTLQFFALHRVLDGKRGESKRERKRGSTHIIFYVY